MDQPQEGDRARIEPQLPVVASPRLDGSAPDEDIGETAAESAAGASLSRSLRFGLLAASVATAAALGSFVGALSASGVNHLRTASAERPKASVASTVQTSKAELAELSALKSSLDGATRGSNGQFAKLADRLDRLERMQIEAATKVARITEGVDRLDKKGVVAALAAAAPETTGSIAASPPSPAIKPSDRILPDKVLSDWIVQDVRGGHALIENSRGGVFDVVAGGVLPGLGRIETIKRQDGQWVVVTPRGLISSAP